MGTVPPPDLVAQLKAPMLARVGRGGTEESNLIGYLLSAWASGGPQQIVFDAELRDALVLGGDDVRRTMLRFVSDWAEDNDRWRALVMPFITKVWPKQRTMRKPQMSSALVRFASSVPQQFAAVMQAVMPGLVPLSIGHDLHLDCEVADLDVVGIAALVTALQRLLPSERGDWPYEGKRLVDAIVATGAAQGPELDELSRRAAERDF